MADAITRNLSFLSPRPAARVRNKPIRMEKPSPVLLSTDWVPLPRPFNVYQVTELLAERGDQIRVHPEDAAVYAAECDRVGL